MKISELSRLRDKSIKKFEFYKKRFDLISYFRLIDFIFLFISLILFLVYKEYIWLISTIVFSGIFIILIYIHEQINNQKKYFMNRMIVVDDYISRINGEWIYRFEETGSFYNDENNRMLEDLNVVGEASLFSYLNVAASSGGKTSSMTKNMISNHSGKEECYGYGIWLKKTKNGFIPYFQGFDPGVSFISSYDIEKQLLIVLVSNYGDNVWKMWNKIKDIEIM